MRDQGRTRYNGLEVHIMAAELSVLKLELMRIERELKAVRAKIERLEGRQPGEEPPFAKLRGICKGADITEEEIDAVKIRVKDFPK